MYNYYDDLTTSQKKIYNQAIALCNLISSSMFGALESMYEVACENKLYQRAADINSVLYCEINS